MKIAITSFAVLFSVFCQAQSYFKNAIEINMDYGVSGNFQDALLYEFQFSTDQIIADRKSTVRSRNYQFGYIRYILPNHGLKASFGISNFGFNLEGNLLPLGAKFNNSYTIRLLEFGLSYIGKIPYKNLGQIIIEPGLRFHSDGSTETNGISINRKDAYGFSLYTGYELPMAGNNMFINLGLQLKLPLQPYSSEFNKSPDYYPYFVGMKLGVNFQFQAFNF